MSMTRFNGHAKKIQRRSETIVEDWIQCDSAKSQYKHCVKSENKII